MKKYIIMIFVALSLFSCTEKSNANNPDEDNLVNDLKKTYALEDYQQDFKQMVDILVKKHPQPFTFISEDSFYKLVDVQYNKINETTTMGAFSWICEELVAAINCGHTTLHLHKDFGGIPVAQNFPIKAKYVGSKLFVVEAKNNSDKLADGTEILAINGVSAEEIKKDIFKHISTDGYNESRKHVITNRYFDWYCSFFFDFPNAYTVTVRQNDKIEEIKLKEAEDLTAKKTFLDDCEDYLCFDMNPERSIAIITIRSFGFYRKRFEIFKSFVDDCFQQIKENKIQNLVIDLRNNGGGDPFCGSYLYQYISDKPYQYFHNSVPLYSKLKTTIQPNSNRFKNKLFFLVNGGCSSTTGHFCSLVKENDLGVFVGDETGATYTCNDFSKNYTLKNTKFIVHTARKIVKTTAKSLSNEHGIKPDFYVTPNIDNILTNTDTVLNFTLNLIEKN